jgi:hypothetical protein
MSLSHKISHTHTHTNEDIHNARKTEEHALVDVICSCSVSNVKVRVDWRITTMCSLNRPHGYKSLITPREDTRRQTSASAILCVVLTCGGLIKGHQVWFWCDNTTSLSVVIHGYARSSHLPQMTNEIHLQFTWFQITSWFEWVLSKYNITDIPIRPQGQGEYDFTQKRESQGDKVTWSSLPPTWWNPQS